MHYPPSLTHFSIFSEFYHVIGRFETLFCFLIYRPYSTASFDLWSSVLLEGNLQDLSERNLKRVIYSQGRGMLMVRRMF